MTGSWRGLVGRRWEFVAQSDIPLLRNDTSFLFGQRMSHLIRPHLNLDFKEPKVNTIVDFIHKLYEISYIVILLVLDLHICAFHEANPPSA